MQADVVISWSFAPVPSAVKAKFQRPTKFIEIPTPPSRTYFAQVNSFGWNAPCRAIINKYAPGTEPLRIAALGFSESCHGVRNLLGSGDGGRFDAAIAIDGVHTPYVQQGNKKVVDPNTMAPWFELGKWALLNKTLLAISYSSIVPPGYASTTETADWLWAKLIGDQSFTEPAVPAMSAPETTIQGVTYPAVTFPEPPAKLFRRARGLVELGFSNIDKKGGGKTDHIYQAKVILPLVLEKLLVERWNAIDPKDPGAGCYVAGVSAAPGLGGPCAESLVLPASYMTNTDSAFIVSGSTPGAGPNPVQPEPSASAPTSIEQRDNTVFKVGAAAIGVGLLYYALN